MAQEGYGKAAGHPIKKALGMEQKVKGGQDSGREEGEHSAVGIRGGKGNKKTVGGEKFQVPPDDGVCKRVLYKRERGGKEEWETGGGCLNKRGWGKLCGRDHK